MTTYWLRFALESDATFGRGDGVPGLVDQEVTLDRYGCPYLHGRTLKGLLNEVCADILYALGKASNDWILAATNLFGQPGSNHVVQGIMEVGHGQLPAAVRQAVRNEIASENWSRDDVLHALTTIRRQTAIEVGGVPDPHTLRAVRVILRDTPFEARLSFSKEPEKKEKALLAACVKGFRRAGTARNRGRGRLAACLADDAVNDVTEDWYKFFKEEVCP